MAVTSSHVRSICLLFAVLALCTDSQAIVMAQQDTVALGNRLRDEAKAAKSLEQQTLVLKKIEKLRRRDDARDLRPFLKQLQGWLLHQRGETYVQMAADANAQSDLETGRVLDARAMTDFDAAIKLDPNRWKSYHHRGVSFALAGRFQESLDDFSKTIELRPEYESAWFNRGEIHYELGQFAKAIADYDEAIRIQPRDAGFFTSRGHANFQLRRFDQALSDYTKACEIDPENAEFWANRGDAHRSLGQWKLAANDFREAINLDNRFGRAYQAAAWLMSTCPEEEFRNGVLAVRAARKALELDGDGDYIYLDTLAASLANVGQYDEARRVVRQAISFAPAENAATLRHRHDLYRAGKPFRQHLGMTAKRSRSQNKRF